MRLPADNFMRCEHTFLGWMPAPYSVVSAVIVDGLQSDQIIQRESFLSITSLLTALATAVWILSLLADVESVLFLRGFSFQHPNKHHYYCSPFSLLNYHCSAQSLMISDSNYRTLRAFSNQS